MYNVIKFQAPFERIKHHSSIPEINLLKAIITQAIIDASNISDSPETRNQTKEARSWIFGDEEHEFFKEICILVGLEPSFIIRIARETIRQHSSQKLKTPQNRKILSKPLKEKQGLRYCKAANR